MTKPKVGSTYPTVTGENTPKGAAFTRIVQEFPELQLWSVYYDGSDLPNWNIEEWFKTQYDHIDYYLLSFKTSDLNAISNSLSSMPTHLRGRILVFLHHEPDQWRSTSDRRGDPDPWVWAQRQVDFNELRFGAPWEDWIQHWACFTEDRFRTDKTFWMSNWGNWILTNRAIFDGMAWDVFNIGRSIIRTGQDMFSAICDFNRQGEWPIAIREWGQVTPTDSPEDSPAVADGVGNHYVWMRDNAADLLPLMVWYYNHNNTLVDPSGNRPGRPLTLDVLQQCLVDALTPVEEPEEPDPNHPQYYFGYHSRDDEVAALHQAVTDALEQGKAQGRIEAFGEVVNWAQTQS
jgi:hypothetical protein